LKVRDITVKDSKEIVLFLNSLGLEKQK